MVGSQQQVQSFGDITMGDGNVFTINQILQISPSVVQTRPFNPTSPYQGLKSFQFEDKDRFFGRDRLVADLMAVTTQRNLLIILGASGSGKSSLVRAGLIPQLAEQLGSKFRAFIFTPDRDPFYSLWISLVGQGFKQSEAEIALTESTASLTQVIRLLKLSQEQWLIFIDQFEELFTLCQDAEKRQKFIGALVQVIEAKNPAVKIVIAMRAEFLERFGAYPTFGRIADKNLHLITDMHADELRLAIEQPAAHHGVVFEPGLVTEIIQDVQGQPGSLPLLQYTLNLLWQHDQIEDRILNIKTYRELGGVRGALQKRVNEIYQSLGAAEQEATKGIFLRLVTISGAANEAESVGKAMSRRAYLSEFPEAVQPTLYKLIDHNLLVSDRQQQSTIEIAHDTLLHSWPKLKQWIEESKEVILLRNRLSEDAKNWQMTLRNAPQDAAEELWSGSKLERVVELRSDRFFELVGGLNALENEFINASVQEGDRNRLQAEQRRQRQMIAAWTTALIGSMLALFAGIQWRKAEIEQIRAFSASSEALFASNQSLEALLKSLQAATKLEQPVLRVFAPNPELRNLVIARLQTVVYSIQERNRLQAYQGGVISLTWTPDPQKLITAGEDGSIYLWNLTQKQPLISSFKAHEGQVLSVSFSRDRDQLASAGDDGYVRLWNLSGRSLGEFRAHPGSVWSVNFSPDGSKLVTAGNDGFVRLWDLSGNPLAQFKAHQGSVWSVNFSPDGTQLASAGYDGITRIWDLTGKPLAELTGHQGQVFSVSWSPDGQRIATAGYDGTARLWNVATGNQLAEFKGHQGPVRSVTFSLDGFQLATAGYDGTARLWDLSGQQLAAFKGHQGPLRSTIFSADGLQLISAGADGTIRFWAKERQQQLAEFKGHQGWFWVTIFNPTCQPLSNAALDLPATKPGEKLPAKFPGYPGVTSAVLSPDGTQLATSGADCTARLWDKARQQQLTEFKGHQGPVWMVKFRPDGEQLATAGADGSIRLWTKQGEQIAQLQGHQGDVWSLDFRADGQQLVSGGADGTVRIWDIATQQQQSQLQGHRGEVFSVSWNSQPNLIASGGSDGTARVWDLESQQAIAVFPADPQWVKSVNWNPAGDLLATAGSDSIIRLWDLQRQQQVTQFRGHQGAVNSLSWSQVASNPNRLSLRMTNVTAAASQLASAGADGTVRLWDLQREQELVQFAAHPSAVNSVSFSSDGKQLVTAGRDGSAKLWPVEGFEELIARGCEWIGDYLETHENEGESSQVCRDRN